jgi:hypothetical protein
VPLEFFLPLKVAAVAQRDGTNVPVARRRDDDGGGGGDADPDADADAAT